MARSQPADILPEALQAAYQQFRYYWLAAPAGKTAELLALFCRVCSLEASGSQDLPLVSVLRDTLGDSDPKNDRVFYVWFLTSSRPSFGQRLLSAVPFSCWRVGAGSQNVNVTPRIDLSAPAPDCTRIVFGCHLFKHNAEYVGRSGGSSTFNSCHWRCCIVDSYRLQMNNATFESSGNQTQPGLKQPVSKTALRNDPHGRR